MEIREGGDIVVAFDDNLTKVQMRGTSAVAGPERDGFNFDRVFPMGTKQQEVFDYGVKGCVLTWPDPCLHFALTDYLPSKALLKVRTGFKYSGCSSNLSFRFGKQMSWMGTTEPCLPMVKPALERHSQ